MQNSAKKQNPRKRGTSTAVDDEQAPGPSKRPRATKGQSAKSKGKAKVSTQPSEWPEYFDALFKVGICPLRSQKVLGHMFFFQIFKALNTVLAFCSSRKQLAITFPVVRASVEGLLRHPLELSKVAELKALLPDIISFAYIPTAQLRIHEDSVKQVTQDRSSSASKSADFSLPPSSIGSDTRPLGLTVDDEDEHVLVLDFHETTKGKKTSNPGFMYTLPPALTPAATKKLVEKRNERFVQAVNELLQATPEGENPADLLQAAARDHIPIDPNKPKTQEPSREVPDPQHRPAIEDVILDIQQQQWYSEQISYHRIFDAKLGQNAELAEPLPESIQTALREARKINSLYTHQVAAINALSEGQHVIVSTSTASGKSVIYQVPLLRFLKSDSHAKAIFIYPTKALAQDQKAALEQLLCACPGLEHIKVSTYDGDTPQEHRREIRETASVIFTNFDMIHASILPHEDVWRSFLKYIKLVAVDELHYYAGIFGSHVAQVIRRFRRVCAAIGNKRVQFVSCSATIAKPSRHMSDMFGVSNVVEVTEDGAPAGRKDFLIWQPPLKDPQDPDSGHKSALSEATALMRYLMARGVRVILFCKIRKACEQAMKQLRGELTADGRLDILGKVMAYRGGTS
ncbi:hypothetical protein QCA50_002857 [Cerrena zonata]|uniref:Helicase ATP-binding domain-containing protein n=1 Tax=Cerrena zonata TaxID=2478898 RepID=A0AAW0GQJ4_9APHY